MKKTYANYALFGLLSCTAFSYVNALPVEPKVVEGSAGIEVSGNGLEMHVSQSSERVLIDAVDTSVARNELLSIGAPATSAWTVFRHTGDNHTDIAGNVTSNANVMFMNQNGIVVRDGARVDVNGLALVAKKIDGLAEDGFGFAFPADGQNAGKVIIEEGSRIAAAKVFVVGSDVAIGGDIASDSLVVVGDKNEVSLYDNPDGMLKVIPSKALQHEISEAKTLKKEDVARIMSSLVAPLDEAKGEGAVVVVTKGASVKIDGNYNGHKRGDYKEARFEMSDGANINVVAAESVGTKEEVVAPVSTQEKQSEVANEAVEVEHGNDAVLAKNIKEDGVQVVEDAEAVKPEQEQTTLISDLKNLKENIAKMAEDWKAAKLEKEQAEMVAKSVTEVVAESVGTKEEVVAPVSAKEKQSEVANEAVEAEHGNDAVLAKNIKEDVVQVVEDAKAAKPEKEQTRIVVKSVTKRYGDKDPDFLLSIVSADPVKKGNLAASMNVGFERQKGEDVGSYPVRIVPVRGVKDQDVLVDGTLDIIPAELTIVAKDAEKVVGDEDPALLYEVRGIKNGDQISPTVMMARVQDAGGEAGSYPIKILSAFVGNKNYRVEKVIDGRMVIHAKPSKTKAVSQFRPFKGFRGFEGLKSLGQAIGYTAEIADLNARQVQTFTRKDDLISTAAVSASFKELADDMSMGGMLDISPEVVALIKTGKR